MCFVTSGDDDSDVRCGRTLGEGKFGEEGEVAARLPKKERDAERYAETDGCYLIRRYHGG